MSLSTKTLRKLLIFLTILLSGRAMTLFFIASAGTGQPGAAPDAWLMPLLGDAFIGIGALVVVYLLVKKKTFSTWLIALGWNLLGIWDALSAYIIHTTNPWPDFFMIETFGSSMFFMAAAMHGFLIWILFKDNIRKIYLNAQ